MPDLEIHEARFTATALDDTDDLFVTIAHFDGGESPWGPVVWRPGPDAALPSQGDRALVTRSDEGFWWVLQWLPTT